MREPCGVECECVDCDSAYGPGGSNPQSGVGAAAIAETAKLSLNQGRLDAIIRLLEAAVSAQLTLARR